MRTATRARLSRALTANCALLVVGGATGARAQAVPQHGAVSGVVRSTLGDRIPYAVVALEPGLAQRFTDDSGSFAFRDLTPGAYRLRARQVGFKPFDTTVTVTSGSAAVVAIALEHLVVQLDEIRVVARAGTWGRCVDPGPPDPAAQPDLAAIFNQLRENAARFWLLADSFPAVYRMERSFARPDLPPPGAVGNPIDTVDLRTDARWRYAPGRVVVEEEPVRGGPGLRVNLPTLPDFADETFLANHCFRLGGVDTLEGWSYVRVDFRAAERIAHPDADGAAYLDPDTYLVHLVRVELTRPGTVMSGLVRFQATVLFREIVPSLVLPDRIASVQSIAQPRSYANTREDQRMVEFRFLRALPGRLP